MFQGAHRSETRVAPRADIVLILLIIFVLVTPLLIKRLWVPLRGEDHAHEKLAAE